MSFIVAMLLLYMSELETFQSLINLVGRRGSLEFYKLKKEAIDNYVEVFDYFFKQVCVSCSYDFVLLCLIMLLTLFHIVTYCWLMYSIDVIWICSIYLCCLNTLRTRGLAQKCTYSIGICHYFVKPCPLKWQPEYGIAICLKVKCS